MGPGSLRGRESSGTVGREREYSLYLKKYDLSYATVQRNLYLYPSLKDST